MQLAQALRLGKTPRLAFVGAGGKTTALFQLARELLQRPENKTVIATASTHLRVDQCTLADYHLTIHQPTEIEELASNLQDGLMLLTGPQVEEQRTRGLAQTNLTLVHAQAQAHDLPLLVEADGSRQRPLKAPAEYEPAIPEWVEIVLVVVGLSALGKPLAEPWIHRVERFSRLTGIPIGEPISPQAVIRALTNPEGGQKNIPTSARRCVLLNQADTIIQQAQGYQIARELLSDYDSIVIASLRQQSTTQQNQSTIWAVHQPVAGIILAAGASKRIHHPQLPKQLLDWRGQPFIRNVALKALAANLSPVIVVTGYQSPGVQAAVQDLPVQIAYNSAWEHGQSTSVIAGLNCLPPQCGAAIFLLADQPQISVSVLRSLVERHAATQAPIIAPLADGQRTNPVLFDQSTFTDLLALNGDTGGRVLFSRYPIQWLPWHDASLCLDVDTPEDYQKLIANG